MFKKFIVNIVTAVTINFDTRTCNFYCLNDGIIKKRTEKIDGKVCCLECIHVVQKRAEETERQFMLFIDK